MKMTVVCLLAVCAWTLNAAADEPKTAPQPVRTLLERHDLSGVPGKEVVIGTATLPAGSSFAFHTHPGDEIGYVLKGPLIWKVRGQPDRTLQSGDSFFNARGVVHSIAAPADGDGAVGVSAWIVDKGQPLATPVP